MVLCSTLSTFAALRRLHSVLAVLANFLQVLLPSKGEEILLVFVEWEEI